MTKLYKLTGRLTPIQSLLAGYVFIILVGSVLLSLPIASSGGVSQPRLDAVFTATSAVTTTGLVVVETGSYYSTFGQVVILVLFQVGGLGYMIFVALISHILGMKLSVSGGVSLQESMAGVSLGNIKGIVKSVVTIALFFEMAGAVLLSLRWAHEYPFSEAVYMGIFHSVSAFCTAGFGLLPDSLRGYREDIAINLVINAVCMAGGLGFFVLLDMQNLFKRTASHIPSPRLSIHSRLALLISAILVVVGTGVIYMAEYQFSKPHSGHGLISSVFQSISASTTTGFNTMDIGAMSNAGLFITVILMFVGASPGGSGGGIKNTTFAVMLASLFQVLKKRRDAQILKRRISQEVVNKSFALGLMAVLLVSLDVIIMTFTEKASFIQILFEAVSAFGTVGLSAGITPDLSAAGKYVISITMLIGRLGPLAIGFALVGKPRPERSSYAEGEVFVG